jgi:hypothetical protein
MFKRLLGLIIIAVACLGIFIGYGMFRYGGEVLDNLVTEVVVAIDLLDRTIDTTKEGLVNTRASLAEVNNSLDTVETTTRNVSRTVADTQPLITQVNTLVTQEVPNSLDAVQQALPNLVNVAGTIDNTLMALSTFGFEQSFFGIPLAFDLGIEYNPDARLDTSIAVLGETIEDLPGQLRTIEGDLDNTSDNLDELSANLVVLADDLGKINESLAQFDAVLGGYIIILDDVKAELARLENSLPAQIEAVKMALLVVALYIGLTQLASLYLGAELLFGWRNVPKVQASVVAAAEEPVKEVS